MNESLNSLPAFAELLKNVAPLPQRLERQLAFLLEVDKMKNVQRMTVLTDLSRRETDAEHSWHFAMMAMTLLEYAAELVNEQRVLRMALVHDLVEIYAGDTFAYDTAGYEDKEQRENQAADQLFAMLPAEQGAEFRALWEEFDRMDTPDSRFAASVDRIQPFIINCVTEGHTWAHHVTSVQVYQRMGIVQTALPALWPFVEDCIRNGVAKGWLLP